MIRLLLIDDHRRSCGGFVASCGALRKDFAVTVAETAAGSRGGQSYSEDSSAKVHSRSLGATLKVLF